MLIKDIKKNAVYTNGTNERKTLKILQNGVVKYRVVKKDGPGQGRLGGFYSCGIQTFASWARSEVTA